MGPFSPTVEETRSDQSHTTVWVWIRLVYTIVKMKNNGIFSFLFFVRWLQMRCVEIHSRALFFVMVLWFWAELGAPKQLPREVIMLIFMSQNIVSRLHLHTKLPVYHWNSNARFSSHFNVTICFVSYSGCIYLCMWQWYLPHWFSVVAMV